MESPGTIYRKKVALPVPSLILNQSYDKVVDKILSRRTITLKAGKNGKGSTFETELERLIKDSGYRWGKTNQDSKKGVPEIDGAFLLSEKTLVVYEAKCSVKPEERADAYRFVENHLVRALDQLAKRISYLRHCSDDASQRLGFPVHGCQIVPLVITNHPYFTGLEIVTSGADNAHVLDYDLFAHIVSRRVVPSWSYDAGEQGYRRSEVRLETVEELLEAIKKPWAYLRSMAPAQVQVSEDGVAFRIGTTPVIHDLPF